MNPYPASLPIDAIQLIVADIRNGAVASDRENFAKAVWELAGYGLKVGLGDPSPVGVKTCEPPLTDEQVAEHLEALLPAPEGVARGLDVAAVLALVPWRPILKWALTALAATL